MAVRRAERKRAVERKRDAEALYRMPSPVRPRSLFGKLLDVIMVPFG
jgi:hypothetical protein